MRSLLILCSTLTIAAAATAAVMEKESPAKALDRELLEDDVAAKNQGVDEELTEDRLLAHFMPQDRARVRICE